MNDPDKNTELATLSTSISDNLIWWILGLLILILIFWILRKFLKSIKKANLIKNCAEILAPREELDSADKKWIEDILLKTGWSSAEQFVNRQSVFEDVIERYRKLYPEFHPNVKNLPVLRQKLSFTIQQPNIKPRNSRYFYSGLNLKAYVLHQNEFIDYQARVLVVYEHELWISPPDVNLMDEAVNDQFPVTLVVSRHYETPIKFTCKIIHLVHHPKPALILKHAEYTEQLAPRVAPRKPVTISATVYKHSDSDNSKKHLDGSLLNVSAKGAQFQTHQVMPVLQDDDAVQILFELNDKHISIAGQVVNISVLNHEFRNINIQFSGGIEKDLKALRTFLNEK